MTCNTCSSGYRNADNGSKCIHKWRWALVLLFVILFLIAVGVMAYFVVRMKEKTENRKPNRFIYPSKTPVYRQA